MKKADDEKGMRAGGGLRPASGPFTAFGMRTASGLCAAIDLRGVHTLIRYNDTLILTKCISTSQG